MIRYDDLHLAAYFFPLIGRGANDVIKFQFQRQG